MRVPREVYHWTQNTALCLLFIGSFTAIASASGVTLQAGDLLIGDQSADVLFLVDPITGVQTPITSGGFLDNTWGIAVDSGGDILLSDTLGGLVRVDPSTGIQTAIPNSVTHFTRSIVLEPGGDLFVCGYQSGTSGGVSRVNPVTGQTTPISTAGLLHDPQGIQIDAMGQLVMGNWFVGGSAGSGALIVRIDPNTGVQTTIGSGGLLQNVTDMTLLPDGTIVAVGNVYSGTSGLYTIDPTSGAQTLVSTGGLFVQPFDVALESSGTYVVADRGSKSVFRVDPNTGAQTVISQYGLFNDPVSVFVVGEVGVGEAYCFGDDSGTVCPCGNNGVAGTGCANSTGVGARLSLVGSPSVGADDLTINLTQGRPGNAAIVFTGTLQAGGGAGTVFSDGLLCATGNTSA